MDPEGKSALVTGAGSGIGLALSAALAERGARIAALDVDPAGLEAARGAAAEAGGEAASIEVDVSRRDELADAFAQAEDRLDGLDIVCNNAGVNTGRPRFPDAPPERWRRTLAIDLEAVVAGTQLAVEALRRRGAGVIVNTASLAAVTPFPADPIYGAAKAGVVGLTQSLAFLDQEGIRVVCICPGVVDTPLLKRRDLSADEEEVLRSIPLLRAAEVAEQVVKLIEDDATHAVALGLLPGRPARVIEPPLRFEDDPTEAFRS